MCNLANCSKPEKGDFERAFARIKQMNDIDYDKHWGKKVHHGSRESMISMRNLT